VLPIAVKPYSEPNDAPVRIVVTVYVIGIVTGPYVFVPGNPVPAVFSA